MAQWLEGKIDFEGQKLAQNIIQYVLISAAVVSFLAGVAVQSLTVTFATYGLAVLVLAAVVLPPWPFLNRHPVTWLPVRGESKKSK